MTSNFSYVRPKSLKTAIDQLSAEGARIHAGGTDLLGCLKDEVFDVSKVVSLGDLTELQGISENAAGGMRIGALTTINELSLHPKIAADYAALLEAAAEVASPQLRYQGTVGGNLCQKPRCWYYRGEFHCLRKGGDTCYAMDGENQYHCILGADMCCIVHPSDTAPALVALDAVVRIAGPKKPREVKLDEFFVLPSEDVTRENVLQPNEIVTEVILPPPPRGLRSSYRKVRARKSWDFALASVALALQFDGKVVKSARIVLGGAAPVPWRSQAAEDILTGSRLDDATINQAARTAVADAEPLDKNGYKIPLFVGILEEELAAIRP
jgi:xanthine dehydrogenase YagS FAD-binding subunit